MPVDDYLKEPSGDFLPENAGDAAAIWCGDHRPGLLPNGFVRRNDESRISVLNIWVQRLYSCGFRHDQPLLEGETQGVRNRISRFSFPSTRL
jgi:hypothetical protein